MNLKERYLLWSSNLWNFSDGLLGPLFAVFTQKIGGDIMEITYAWAAYLFTTGVLTIYFGKLSDKLNNKELLCFLGYFLNTICTFGYLFVSNTFELLILQVGLGFSLALANPTWDSLYQKYMSKKKTGYLNGLASGEARILTAGSIILGGAVIKFTSFEVLFIFMGCIQLIATFYQAKLLYK